MKTRFRLELLSVVFLGAQMACTSPQKNQETGDLAIPAEYAEELNGNDSEIAPLPPDLQPEQKANLSMAPAAPKTPAELPSGESTSVVSSVSTPVLAQKGDRSIASLPLAPSSSGKEVDYVVQPGDTLMKISFQLLGDLSRWQEIYSANRTVIQNPSVLSPGIKLKVRLNRVAVVEKNGMPYSIKKGDTLSKISNWIYGTLNRWKDLWNNNRQLIHDPNKIYAGFKMYYESPNVRTPASEVKKTSK